MSNKPFRYDDNKDWVRDILCGVNYDSVKGRSMLRVVLGRSKIESVVTCFQEVLSIENLKYRNAA